MDDFEPLFSQTYCLKSLFFLFLYFLLQGPFPNQKIPNCFLPNKKYKINFLMDHFNDCFFPMYFTPPTFFLMELK